MQSSKEPGPARVMAATAIILVLIDIFAWKVHTFLGVVLLPFAFFGVLVALFRISSPWYIRKKALSYIQKKGGRVHQDDLINYLTPVGRNELDREKNREVIEIFVHGLEESEIIWIQPDGTVTKAGWGGRTK